ncbi:hypothetical protein MMC17_001693 [Xylographa soralifera]|nr:hypothetical protein [Xylographa soralifera]
MSDEQVVVTDFQETTRDYWATRDDYDTVNAILLCWKDDDLKVRPEVDRLQELFEKDFNFKTRIDQIPSESPPAQLQFELAAFVKQFSLQRKSLTIVYYAGHADKVEDTSPAGYSVWRAKEKGGPILNWFELQHALYAAQGDTLVILDCGHAALKTRGTKNGKMEILAACGSGSRVPEPGRLSFTSVLIRQICKQLKVRPSMSIKWLHSHLWGDKTEPGLTETPIYFDLSEHDQRSIILKPLLAAPPAGFTRKHKPITSFLFLKVSLADDPTGLQIANWLKSFPPAVIQDVDIEGLVLKARRLESLTDHNAMFPISILGKLSSSAQKEILARLKGLSQTISTTAAIAKEADIGSTAISSAISGPEFTSKIINDFEEKVSYACSGIEGSILLDDGVDLQEAVEDEAVMAAEAHDAITLRQALLNTSRVSDFSELPRESIKFARVGGQGSNNRFRYGQHAGKTVIVERFHYSVPSSESIEPSNATLLALKRMVDLLSRPKTASFHILPCLGYIQERHVRKFGIVFDTEKRSCEDERPMTLQKLYSFRTRVPLGDRISIAHALATALVNFHRVGWVHKEIRSNVILFFNKLPAAQDQDLKPHVVVPDIDLSQPWLCGFEGSRPEEEESRLQDDYSGETNAYRHPDRWGQPKVRFEKSHDIYALGIVFLEIARWKLATRFEEIKAQPLRPSDVKPRLLAQVAKDLPHQVGQSYADVVDACLRFQELTAELNEYDKHKVFEAKILGPLKRAITIA